MDGLARLHFQVLDALIPTCVSLSSCAGTGAHCPCSLPVDRGSFSEPGPAQPLVKDGVERAALGEWRQNRREMSPPK